MNSLIYSFSITRAVHSGRRASPRIFQALFNPQSIFTRTLSMGSNQESKRPVGRKFVVACDGRCLHLQSESS
jgi:hypothetical protein